MRFSLHSAFVHAFEGFLILSLVFLMCKHAYLLSCTIFVLVLCVCVFKILVQCWQLPFLDRVVCDIFLL